MRIDEKNPPRAFNVECALPLTLKDCAHIELSANEQVTFKTSTGAEYDVVRTPWGYFATPSTNGRLASFGLRSLLVKSNAGRFYVVLCESGKEPDMHRYFKAVGYQIICWLDDEQELKKLESRLKEPA